MRGMETLESSRVCRLCGQHSGISINIFDENENHIRKINAVLPIMVCCYLSLSFLSLFLFLSCSHSCAHSSVPSFFFRFAMAILPFSKGDTAALGHLLVLFVLQKQSSILTKRRTLSSIIATLWNARFISSSITAIVLSPDSTLYVFVLQR